MRRRYCAALPDLIRVSNGLRRRHRLVRRSLQQLARVTVSEDIQAFEAADYAAIDGLEDEEVIVDLGAHRVDDLDDPTPREPEIQHAAPRSLQKLTSSCYFLNCLTRLESVRCRTI